MSMLQSDWPTEQVDAIFFHARSFGGDDDGLFELVEELIKELVTDVVVINGGDGSGVDPKVQAWPGKKEYSVRLGIRRARVVQSAPAVHTLEEANAFSKVAEDHGWKRAVVIAQSFQLPRIMLTHLNVMGKRNYPMRVYAASPRSVCWSKVTNSNQGQPGMSRFEQIEQEWKRIPLYQAQGNLALEADLIEYLLRGRKAI